MEPNMTGHTATSMLTFCSPLSLYFEIENRPDNYIAATKVFDHFLPRLLRLLRDLVTKYWFYVGQSRGVGRRR